VIYKREALLVVILGVRWALVILQTPFIVSDRRTN